VKLRPVWGVVLRQFYLLRGSPIRVVPMFAWVGIDIVLWGFITRYLNTVGTAGMNFVPRLLGAVLLWDFLTRIMQGVSVAFLEDVWSRNFLNLFATPLLVSEYVLGLVVTSVVTSLFGLVVMLVLATAFFGLPFLALGSLAIPFVSVLFLFGIALGILASAMVLRWGPAAEWLIWPLPALIAPFAGVFYPVATLPRWMQAVAVILPPSHIFEALRTVIGGGRPAGSELAWAVGLALFYVLLSALTFTSVYRYVVRSGLLARYSAESVV
jgi:ABC-2 type transport system permease protein